MAAAVSTISDDPYFAPILSAVERWFADSERTVREQAASGSPEAISTDPDALDKEIRPPMQSAMIDAARKDLTERCGLPVEAFYADAFSFSNDANAA